MKLSRLVDWHPITNSTDDKNSLVFNNWHEEIKIKGRWIDDTVIHWKENKTAIERSVN